MGLVLATIGVLGLGACRERADAAVGRGELEPLRLDVPAPLPLPAKLDASAATLDVATMVERVRPVVVTISSARTTGTPVHGDPASEEREHAVGSGFIVGPDGLVLTNEHVVHGADAIEVRLADDRRFDGMVVGADAKLDVALVRAKGAEGLPVASVGTSRPLRIGEFVVAIGNPFGLGESVSLGIVSAKGRTIGTGPYDDYIQTDAAINPGNSGGPIFDLQGRVVGISTVVHARARGVGFAIPIDDVLPVLGELKDTGRVTRGRLGISFQALDQDLARVFRLPDPTGALIAEVDPEGPAAHGDLHTGDVVKEFDGVSIARAGELACELGMKKPGQTVHIVVVRNGSPHAMDVKLDRLTDDDDDTPPKPKARATAHPFGLDLADAPDGGVRVQNVEGASPAADRLDEGDIIVEANGQPVRSARELGGKLAAAGNKPGLVLLRVRRGAMIAFVAIRVR